MYKLLIVILFLWCSNVSAGEGDSDYKLGVGDQVSIKVFRSPDLQTEARVSGNGMINFPLLGQIKLAGFTTTEIENQIAQQLIENGLMVEPNVSVLVTNYQSSTYTILGHVSKPGYYPITRNLKLTDVIAIAGGTTQLASETVIVSSSKNGKEIKNKYDLKQLLDENGGAVNPTIENYDIISVPKYDVFYIYGQVKSPGEYKIESKMRLSQALSISGGLTLLGTTKKMTLEIIENDGKLTNREVDLNYVLQKNDVIYVDESTF